MTQIKLLTLLLTLVAIVIFYLQNQQSIALVFYGITIPIQFPIAVWVLLSLLAGVITSILLQILNGLGRSKSKEREATRKPEPPRTAKTTVNSKQTRSQKKENKPPERPIKEELEWDAPSQKKVDWDGKEIEPEPDLVREIKDDFPFKAQPPLEKNYEVEKKPVSENRSGSVYSYSYGKNTKRDDRVEKVKKEDKAEPKKVDRVYDANYRVIDNPKDDRPPTKSLNEDDEDWI
jgi:uncharacterized integral membrane protein